MSLLLALIAIWALVAILTLRQVALSAASALVLIFWVVLGAMVPSMLSLWALVPLVAVLLVLNVGGLRRVLLTTPVFGLLQKTMPSMSVTEREALEAGTTWWEKELFSQSEDKDKNHDNTDYPASNQGPIRIFNNLATFSIL